MSDVPKLWLPNTEGPIPEVEDDGEYVRVKVDRSLPMGQDAPSLKKMDLYLAMARMSRDGMSRDAIRKELGIDYYVAPNGVRHYITDATLERALARGRAELDRRIAAKLEPEETVSEHWVLKEEEDDD